MVNDSTNRSESKDVPQKAKKVCYPCMIGGVLVIIIVVLVLYYLFK
jgi:hypothetical protein